MTSHPTDIPSDIFATAVGIARDLPSRVQPANRDFAANVIARAILAERERCAREFTRYRDPVPSQERSFAQRVGGA